MSDISIRSAWRQDNRQFEQDAIAFWERLDRLPAGERPEDRAKQLITVAYDGERLVGVTSAFIEFYPPLHQILAFYRILLDPEFRGHNLMPLLVQKAFRVIGQWSKAHPAEQVAGLGSVRQSAHLTENFRSPYGRSIGAAMIGISESGDRVSVRWFDHIRV